MSVKCRQIAADMILQCTQKFHISHICSHNLHLVRSADGVDGDVAVSSCRKGHWCGAISCAMPPLVRPDHFHVARVQLPSNVLLRFGITGTPAAD